MQNISRDLLEEGMMLADHVLNPRGQILIPEGTAIEQKHIKGLKAWGIKKVAITDSTLPEDILQESQLRNLNPDEAKACVKRFFSLNTENLDHPIFGALRDLCLERLTRPTPFSEMNHSSGDDAASEAANNPDFDETKIKKPSMSVEDLINMTTSIATLPNIYFELKNVMNRPSSASADMAKAIRNDPGLTARLLKIVNSAYYSFPTKIETVPRAITIIGTDELTSLVTATSVLQNFGTGLDDLIDMGQFWRHSISAGVAARIIGSKRLEQNVERFFVMGLLHDIGLLPMLSHIPKVTIAAMKHAQKHKIPTYASESELIGFTHAATGAQLAKSWRMSAGQQEAISYHHRPSFAMRYQVEASITHIADILAHILCINETTIKPAPPLDVEAWDKLGIELDVLPKIINEADEKITELIDIFFSNTTDA